MNIGGRDKVCGTVFDFLFAMLNSVIRGDAVVVYDNPSERTAGDAVG